MSRNGFRNAFGAVLTALAFSGAISVASSAADEIPVRFQGRVTGIAAESMTVATDDSPNVAVDLSQVAQDEYQRLATGDLVVVTGTIPTGRNRVVATSIESLEP
jgi:type 1 fimbria pilin